MQRHTVYATLARPFFVALLCATLAAPVRAAEPPRRRCLTLFAAMGLALTSLVLGIRPRDDDDGAGDSPALVAWTLYDQDSYEQKAPELIEDVFARNGDRKGAHSPLRIAPVRRTRLPVDAPVEGAHSFAEAVARAFHSIEKSAQPRFVFALDSHGGKGFAGRQCLPPIPYAKLFSIIVAEAERFEARTGKAPQVSLFLDLCQAGTALPELQKLLASPTGKYRNGGPQRYRFPVELLSSSDGEGDAYGNQLWEQLRGRLFVQPRPRRPLDFARICHGIECNSSLVYWNSYDPALQANALERWIRYASDSTPEARAHSATAKALQIPETLDDATLFAALARPDALSVHRELYAETLRRFADGAYTVPQLRGLAKAASPVVRAFALRGLLQHAGERDDAFRELEALASLPQNREDIAHFAYYASQTPQGIALRALQTFAREQGTASQKARWKALFDRWEPAVRSDARFASARAFLAELKKNEAVP